MELTSIVGEGGGNGGSGKQRVALRGPEADPKLGGGGEGGKGEGGGKPSFSSFPEVLGYYWMLLAHHSSAQHYISRSLNQVVVYARDLSPFLDMD